MKHKDLWPKNQQFGEMEMEDGGTISSIHIYIHMYYI